MGLLQFRGEEGPRQVSLDPLPVGVRRRSRYRGPVKFVDHLTGVPFGITPTQLVMTHLFYSKQ